MQIDTYLLLIARLFVINETVMIKEINNLFPFKFGIFYPFSTPRMFIIYFVSFIFRNGPGKVKHLDVKSLWIQERESNGDLQVVKVPRLQNSADLLTHQWSEAEGELHLSTMGFVRL